MMWKKVVAAIFVGTLAFVLAGCGTDKTKEEAAGKSDKVHLTRNDEPDC